MQELEVDVLVIGAGLAGLSAGLRLSQLGVNFVVLEGSNEVGGHAKSQNYSGAIFDEGPHVLFSDDDEMLEWLGCPTQTNYQGKPSILNLWQGRKLGHPAQLDLANMTPIQQLACANSLLESDLLEYSHFENYREFLEANFGTWVSTMFHEVYTNKYWRCRSSDLSGEEFKNRVAICSEAQKQLIREALKTDTLSELNLALDSHYFAKFAYPERGGGSLNYFLILWELKEFERDRESLKSTLQSASRTLMIQFTNIKVL